MRALRCTVTLALLVGPIGTALAKSGHSEASSRRAVYRTKDRKHKQQPDAASITDAQEERILGALEKAEQKEIPSDQRYKPKFPQEDYNLWSQPPYKHDGGPESPSPSLYSRRPGAGVVTQRQEPQHTLRQSSPPTATYTNRPERSIRRKAGTPSSPIAVTRENHVTKRIHQDGAAIDTTIANDQAKAVVHERIKNALPSTVGVSRPATATTSTTPWVQRYLRSRPMDVLLPVPRDFLQDPFNMAQLAPIIDHIGFQAMGSDANRVSELLTQLEHPQPSHPMYRLACQLLLSDEEEAAEILQHPIFPSSAIQTSTEALFLYLHARFAVSPRGLDALCRALLHAPVFGRCPRRECQGSKLLPHGSSNDFDVGNHSTCQRHCPVCSTIWNYWDSTTDGCAWGPSLSHLLLLTHGKELFPHANPLYQRTANPTIIEEDINVFGFRLHPQAQWG